MSPPGHLVLKRPRPPGHQGPLEITSERLCRKFTGLDVTYHPYILKHVGKGPDLYTYTSRKAPAHQGSYAHL